MFNFLFFINSILLGIGLAMDAFSVSLVNGLNEPHMKSKQVLKIAGTFAGFQGIMPIAGWFMVHTISQYFKKLEKAIPCISLILLVLIGSNMLLDGLKSKNPVMDTPSISNSILLTQGFATSIDALSVGFTIANYHFFMVLICAFIIAFITLLLCILGIKLGKKAGAKLSDKASILGGILLICIGFETFFSLF